jgi:hypothetical protein
MALEEQAARTAGAAIAVNQKGNVLICVLIKKNKNVDKSHIV